MLPGTRCRMAVMALGCVLLLRVSPMSVYNSTVLLLGNSCGWAWQTVRAVPAATSPLKAAILNVTSDFDQLAYLIGDFMQQPGTDPELEQRFKQYLAERATRSYPRLESLLDWLLAVYKFIFPFLIISLAAKRGGNSREQSSEAVSGLEGAADDALMVLESAGPPTLHTLLSRRSAQHQNGPLIGPDGEAAQQHRQLAVNGTVSSRSCGAALKGGGSVVGRAGSQSPRGPATPVEGTASRPPEWLPARHGAAAAAGKSPRQRQRLAIPDPIDADCIRF